MSCEGKSDCVCSLCEKKGTLDQHVNFICNYVQVCSAITLLDLSQQLISSKRNICLIQLGGKLPSAWNIKCLDGLRVCLSKLGVFLLSCPDQEMQSSEQHWLGEAVLLVR